VLQIKSLLERHGSLSLLCRFRLREGSEWPGAAPTYVTCLVHLCDYQVDDESQDCKQEDETRLVRAQSKAAVDCVLRKIVADRCPERASYHVGSPKCRYGVQIQPEVSYSNNGDHPCNEKQ